jgi:hypothetical protein
VSSPSDRQQQPHGPAGTAVLTAAGQLFDLAARIATAQRNLILSYLRIASRSLAAHRQPGPPAAPAPAEPATTEPATATRPTEPATTDPATTEPAVPVEEVRARAYELYERRGHQAGDPLEDWRRAETELLRSGPDAGR